VPDFHFLYFQRLEDICRAARGGKQRQAATDFLAASGKAASLPLRFAASFAAAVFGWNLIVASGITLARYAPYEWFASKLAPTGRHGCLAGL